MKCWTWNMHEGCVLYNFQCKWTQVHTSTLKFTFSIESKQKNRSSKFGVWMFNLIYFYTRLRQDFCVQFYPNPKWKWNYATKKMSSNATYIKLMLVTLYILLIWENERILVYKKACSCHVRTTTRTLILNIKTERPWKKELRPWTM